MVTITAQDSTALDTILLKWSARFVMKLLARINPAPAKDAAGVALVDFGVEFGQFLAGDADRFIFCNQFVSRPFSRPAP